MPQTYGQSIAKDELEQLVQFLVNNSPAGGTEEEGPGGEEKKRQGRPHQVSSRDLPALTS